MAYKDPEVASRVYFSSLFGHQFLLLFNLTSRLNMCKHIYHHYPSCGHIANWTVDSCIELTNSLRERTAGQMLSCQKTETTHDLLPIASPTLCFQCERGWQEEAEQKDWRHRHAGHGQGYVSIEGLGSLAPISEVHVKSSLGVVGDKEPADPKGDHQDRKKPGSEQDHKASIVNDQRRKQSHVALPPPRFVCVSRPGLSQKKSRKRPVPIVTNAYQVERSSFDTPTPTPTTSTTRTAKPTCPSSSSTNLPPSNPPTATPTKTNCIYNWIPAPGPGPAPIADTSPRSSPFYYSPGSAYSADAENLHSARVAASPLLPFAPRPEEYGSLGMTPGSSTRGAAQGPRLPAESFRNGLCIAFPRLFGEVRQVSSRG